jgi:dTDP-4-amino-4,6-dideoxygalactose transaminase
MNPETFSFDLEDLARKLTPNTKGVIWVHMIGIISQEYQKIVNFCRDHELFLIEDCAHAHGAEIDGKMAGTLGDAGCFSFFPTKVLTTGTGGMITTNNAELMVYAKEVRLLGRHIETGEIVHKSNDWFMDEIRACIGYRGVVRNSRFFSDGDFANHLCFTVSIQFNFATKRLLFFVRRVGLSGALPRVGPLS